MRKLLSLLSATILLITCSGCFFGEWITTVEGNMTEGMTGMDMTTAQTMTAAEALTSVVKR